jgi:hypothetical protein
MMLEKSASLVSAATDDEARDVVRFGGQHGISANKPSPKFQVHRGDFASLLTAAEFAEARRRHRMWGRRS